jgi:UDP-glucose 4-epimerase
VRLVVRLLETGAYGKITNVCSGQGRQVRELVQYVAAQSGIDYQIVEPGEPPRKKDIVVGDPARFLELAGLAAPTSIEATLAAAWQRALIGRAR